MVSLDSKRASAQFISNMETELVARKGPTGGRVNSELAIAA